MSPVTTPTVEPTVAPATKANNNHKISGKDMVNGQIINGPPDGSCHNRSKQNN